MTSVDMLHKKIKRTITIVSSSIIIIWLSFFIINPKTTTPQSHNTAKYNNTTIPNHSSANTQIQDSYKDKFQNMCINNIITCIRIDFDGDFTYKQKYFYLASIIYVSKFIDQNITKDIHKHKNFSQSIKKISLKAKGGKRRGYATHNYIEINTSLIHSYGEFIEIFTHEAWHIVDLGVREWIQRKKDKQYTEFGQARFAIDDPSIAYYKISFSNEKIRKAWSNKEEFCSRYGMTDPFEDFAECTNLYVNHHNLFKYMAKYNNKLQQKYTIINNIFQQHYLQNDSKNIKKLTQKPSRRVWDTTKL